MILKPIRTLQDLSASDNSHLDKKSTELQWVMFELKRIAFLAMTVASMISLVSYSPKDRSWSTWSSQVHFENWMGRSGSILSDVLFQLFGLAAFWVAIIPLAVAIRIPIRDPKERKLTTIGCFVFLFSISGFLHLGWAQSRIPWELSQPAGMLGSAISFGLTFVVGRWGGFFICSVGVLCASVLILQSKGFFLGGRVFRRTFKQIIYFVISLPENLKTIFQIVRTKFEKEKQPEIRIQPVMAQRPQEIIVPTTKPTQQTLVPEEALVPLDIISDPVEPKPVHKIPKLRVHKGKKTDFQLPNLTLISGKAESKSKSVDKNWYLEKATILVQKLKDFGVDGEVVHISPGPVITVYEFKPASGVKIKEIANLSDDLTLALSVLSVRIVAPIPGKPVVGIEIPSPHREMVFFKDLIQETPFFGSELKIPIVLGRSVSGEPVASDLASMPHLLIAGTTGTGKSVFINTLICSLLYRFSPEQLKLMLVDPKMVELSHYEGIPHLLLPVVVDSKKAVMALRWTVDEMERRYTLMHQSGVRHVDIYNEKLAESHKEGKDLENEHLPYIVVVIDEYADLMAVVPKEVELSIARLAQKARASGIHLVLATQRPSTDVVTGTIKANFPSRISFRVASSIDSKTILDRTGSERLLGHGDLLFHSAGFMSLKRMQGPYLSDDDISRVVEYLKSQGEPEYDERILQAQEEPLDIGDVGGDGDESENRLYDLAVRVVSEKGEASISLIQRHLRIGYNRAATLMERMEKEGVVGQSTGPAKRRSVLISGQ